MPTVLVSPIGATYRLLAEGEAADLLAMARRQWAKVAVHVAGFTCRRDRWDGLVALSHGADRTWCFCVDSPLLRHAFASFIEDATCFKVLEDSKLARHAFLQIGAVPQSIHDVGQLAYLLGDDEPPAGLGHGWEAAANAERDEAATSRRAWWNEFHRRTACGESPAEVRAAMAQVPGAESRGGRKAAPSETSLSARATSACARAHATWARFQALVQQAAGRNSVSESYGRALAFIDVLAGMESRGVWVVPHEIERLASSSDPEVAKFAKRMQTATDGTQVFPLWSWHAVSGRAYSSDPNVQGAPVRRDPSADRVYGAPPEYSLLGFDYDQAELRVIAHHSADEKLCESFEQGRDVHVDVAAELVGVQPAEFVAWRGDRRGHVADRMCQCRGCAFHRGREIAKVVNYGVPYGIGAQEMAQDLRQVGIEMTEARCRALREVWFKRHSGVRAWAIGVTKRACERGVVENSWGRVLRVPLPKTAGDRARVARRAVNFIPQSDVADLVREKLVRSASVVPAGVYPAMLVHDEMRFYWPNEAMAQVPAWKAEMERAPFRVPLVVSVRQHAAEGACR